MPDILRLCTILPFCLDIDLPLPAETVKVVDEVASHEGLKGLVDLPEVDPLLENLVTVHLDKELRHGRKKGRCHTGEFRPFARRFRNLLTFSARKAMSFPARSSRTRVAPPASPIP